MAKIHNFFSKLLQCFCTNHTNKNSEIICQTLMNRTCFITYLLKPFVASQLNLKTLQNFHLSYMENEILCYTCCQYGYVVKSFDGLLCGKWQSKLKVSDICDWASENGPSWHKNLITRCWVFCVLYMICTFCKYVVECCL